MEKECLPSTVEFLEEHQRLLNRHKEFLVVSEKAQVVLDSLKTTACCSQVDQTKVVCYVEELKVLYEKMANLSGPINERN